MYITFIFQVEYFKVGSDYSRFRGDGAPSGGPVNRYGIPVGTPVNRILVQKIAPPKVATSMRQLFETGQVPDLQKKVQKLEINREDARESGIYENEPTTREGVVRESDEVVEGEVLTEGAAKNIVHAWKDITAQRGTDHKMATIKIDTSKSGPSECENQPVRLDNVIREQDTLNEVVVPEDGYTDKLRYKFLYPEETKLERGPIKLVEREGERAVFENEPAAPREGVIRSDYEEEQMSYESGYIRNVTGFFAGVSDDKPKQSAPIVIDRSNMMVLENQPTTRDDVVRESDVQDVDAQLSIEQGRTRNLASRWQNMKDEGPQRGPFQMDLAPEAGVLENEPVVLDNVIRCDAQTEDVMLPGAPGRIKSIATRFVSPSRELGERKGMIDIDMAPESGVVENTPAERDPSIVKCDDFTPDQCEVQVSQGTATNLHQKWRQHEEDHLRIRTALDFQGEDKPVWIKELESKGNGGVYENQPDFREGVVRETDCNPDETDGEVIPSNFSRSMKNMWLTREDQLDRELQESRRYIPEVKKGDGRLKMAIREAERDMQERQKETPKQKFERERLERKEREERVEKEKAEVELKRRQEEEAKQKEARRAKMRSKKTTTTASTTAGNKPKVSLFR